MKLQFLDMPDAPDSMASWLDRRLISADLGELVAELLAAQASVAQGNAASARPDFNVWLGDDRERVLASGLAALPTAKLAALLAWPGMLLELQELALIGGGRYWQDLLSECADFDEPWARGRDSLARIWSPPESTAPTTSLQAGPVASLQPGRDASFQAGRDAHSPTLVRSSWLAHPAIASLATAAVLLFGFFVYQSNRPMPPPGQVAAGWGWNKPDAFGAGASAADYLNSLADGAQAWFNKRPDDANGVARRILELRQGCSRLLLAKHEPLSPEDRNWLRERCRLWSSKFDAQVVAIENDADPLEVRGQTDATVQKLIDALHERARTIAAG